MLACSVVVPAWCQQVGSTLTAVIRGARLIAFAACLGLCLVTSACAWRASVAVGDEATASAYARRHATSAVVLLAAYWGRTAGCKPYTDATLVSLGFDRSPDLPDSDDAAPALLLNAGETSALFAPRAFLNYALLVEPGEYELAGFDIRVGNGNEVGHLVAGRSTLAQLGPDRGGSFTVSAGETVYVGNFSLACANGPILWRQYTPRDQLPKHLAEFKSQYPFLNLDDVQFRLFRTKDFGSDENLATGLSKPPPGMGLLAGERSDSVSVFIISIDDDPVLWDGKDRLGNTAAIAPGKHKVLIACAFTTSSGKLSRGGELPIEVEPGKTYDVSGELSADGKKCDVRAKEHA